MVTKPQFVGFSRPQIGLRAAAWGSPPEFAPSSIHTARVMLLNPTGGLWAYKGEVYLDGRIASSGIVEFTIEAGAERPIDFPVVMPEEGSYEAFLDVSVGEELVLHYPFVERVTVAGPAEELPPSFPPEEPVPFKEVREELMALVPLIDGREGQFGVRGIEHQIAIARMRMAELLGIEMGILIPPYGYSLEYYKRVTESHLRQLRELFLKQYGIEF